jgi:hypothetical protein
VTLLVITVFAGIMCAGDYAGHHYAWAVIQAFVCGMLFVAFIAERILR